MKLMASLHAYDCLENVNVSCLVRQYGDYEDGPGEDVLRLAAAVRGEGIDNPREWLRDALLGLLELI